MTTRKPQDKLHRFLGITPLLMKFRVTANQVTVARGILALPVVILANFDLYLPAFLLYLLAWWGDAIDGSLARERLIHGCRDDRDLGQFLDPMVDKAMWVGLVILIPWSGNFESVPDGLFFIGIGAMSVNLVIEAWLGIVRVQDYLANRKGTRCRVELAADKWGKVKMILQVVGLGALILAMDQKDGQNWTYWVWCMSLVVAAPLAAKSLINKYRRRR